MAQLNGLKKRRRDGGRKNKVKKMPETEPAFTPFGQKMIEMSNAQDRENFKRRFGYPVGVDFMTMKPQYWAPAHRVSQIKTLSGKNILI